ncbi:MAG: DUF5110 domain-containing protein [Faecalibacterium sp.]|nr:DUF5110 domain-containing protein [Ruminococcus sp.]MCM1486226.1 DUF5110 domain-containing protein [Faecalibacterium sp.]
MSKFNHKFNLIENGETFLRYTCGDSIARIDFISGSCLRVAIYKNKADMLPTFCVNPNDIFCECGRDRLSTDGFEMFSPEKATGENKHSFALADGIKVEVNPDNFLLTYYKYDQLLFSDRAPLAYNFEHEFGEESCHYISRMSGERIFGLGDKGGMLDKSGRSFRIETTDPMGYDASESDPLYKHIPFYICENSAGCYGIFYDTSDTSYFDFGKEINNYYAPYKYFKTKDDCLVYYVFFGTKLSILRQFTSLCGKQPLPPKWSFDYCASTMAYTDAPDSQKKMNEFIDCLKKYDLSCSGFYLSSGYTSIGSQRYVFNWNNEKFPDVNGFISDFSDKGIEIIPNIKPAFLVDHPLYEQISGNGWFVKNPDGTPFVTEFWDGLGSYLDFTNKQAFEFWKNKVTETLLDYGITATWNDNNEFDIKDTDAVAEGFGDKKVKANRIRPVLTYLMVAASYQAQIAKRPNLRPFLSTRSGNIAVRRFAQTWSGDNRTEFSDLRYCHNIGLTMSLSGLYFYGHDLGGFSGDMPSRELLLRWLQHGVFEPRMTIHSWNSDGSATMPWSYPDIMDSVRGLFAERKQLLPYMYSCAYNASENEIPMNAPTFLYYDDENLYQHSDAMMLGRDIYVAFAFDEGVNKVSAYLPKGDDWYLDDKLYSGGQSVDLTILPTSKMPYFVRSGCVLPTDEAVYGFESEEKIVFTVYPLKDGEFESHFFTDDGVSFDYKNNGCVKLNFTVSCDKDTVKVTIENKGDMPFEPIVRLCEGDGRKVKFVMLNA